MDVLPMRLGEHLPALIVAAALSLLLAGAPAPAADDPFAAMEVQRPAREVAAPAFRLKTPEGKPLALGDEKGKVVAFYFWRTW
jgi:cytochrome oxidase Cu insertion factor (SCO1/SenC/PrrC family)